MLAASIGSKVFNQFQRQLPPLLLKASPNLLREASVSTNPISRHFSSSADIPKIISGYGDTAHLPLVIQDAYTRPKDPKTIAFDKIGFTAINTSHLFVAKWESDKGWNPGAVVEYGRLGISVASGVAYGQTLFEGCKAFRKEDGSVVIFRVEENAKRLQTGARRLGMPEVPESMFIQAVIDTVKANQAYIPPATVPEASLYIRPVLVATGNLMGVKRDETYALSVIVTPVGPYWPGGKITPITLQTTIDYRRAFDGGVGHIKAGGNYAPGIMPASLAKEKGHSEVLYLSQGKNGKEYVEEAGAANVAMILPNNTLVFAHSPSILPGVTRDSVMTLAKEIGITVEFRPIELSELITANQIFCMGTAAGVTPVGGIALPNGEVKTFATHEDSLTNILRKALDAARSGKDGINRGWHRQVS